MEPSIIRYRTGYKYQLAADYRIRIRIAVKEAIKTEFIELDLDGNLLIRSGYAWDGPSGPTMDTKNSLRGSLVHDALYQLMRMELLGQECRQDADDIAYGIWREDGMSVWRAGLWRKEINNWAAFAADPKNKKAVLTAP